MPAHHEKANEHQKKLEDHNDRGDDHDARIKFLEDEANRKVREAEAEKRKELMDKIKDYLK